MKTIKILIVACAAILIASATYAQDAKRNLRNFEPAPKKATFKVYGECEMCKRRIETALKLDGIKSASWDVDSKTLAVIYNNRKINPDKIQQAVAAVGHDTEKYKAANDTYQQLPECCRYKRS